jgi:putative spermidine/putrescine transport system permease protein
VDRKRRRRGNFGLAAVALLVALPFLPLFLWAFAGEWRFPSLIPAEWSLRGFRALAEPGSRALEATLNSLIVGAAATAASVAVGVPAGMALGRYEFRLKGLVVFFILLPILVPPLASTMGVHLTFIRLGLADTAFGVFLEHLVPTVPYTTVILASVFAERGIELEEAARTLGATPWQAFVHITLPSVAAGVAVAALFAFLVSWSQYILTVLIGGGSVLTLPMLLLSAARGSDPVLTSVLALLFVLPAALAIVVALRYLKSGDDEDEQEGLVGVGKVS